MGASCLAFPKGTGAAGQHLCSQECGSPWLRRLNLGKAPLVTWWVARAGVWAALAGGQRGQTLAGSPLNRCQMYCLALSVKRQGDRAWDLAGVLAHDSDLGPDPALQPALGSLITLPPNACPLSPSASLAWTTSQCTLLMATGGPTVHPLSKHRQEVVPASRTISWEGSSMQKDNDHGTQEVAGELDSQGEDQASPCTTPKPSA